MARRAHHYHLLQETKTETYGDGSSREIKIAACGESHAFSFMSSSDFEPTCPKCSQIWAATRLKALKASGQNLELQKEEQTETYPRFKSLYKAILNGEHCGYVAIETGWGQRWLVIGMTLAGDKMYRTYETQRYNNSVKPLRSAHSKEAALSYVPELLTNGNLRTETQVRADAAEFKQRSAEIAERRRKLETEEAEKVADMLIGLKEILERKDLTNFQRDSVVEALARLDKKSTDLT